MINLESLVKKFFKEKRSLPKVSFDFLKKENFKKIVLVGLGGSGLAARMIVSLKEEIGFKKDVDLILCQNYSLPKNLPKKEILVIIISYSGKTKETLNCLQEAKRKKLPIIVISANSLFGKKIQKEKIDFFLLEETISPRFSLWQQLFLLLAIFKELKLIEKEIKIPSLEIEGIIKKAKKISRNFSGKIILIYSSIKNSFLAYHLKIHLNEDGKFLAFSNCLPEAVHNEFLSLPKNKKEVGLIFLEEDEKNPLFKKHLQAIFKNLQAENIRFWQINFGRKNLENYLKQTTFNAVFSFYLAKKNKENILANSFLRKIKKDFQS